MRLRISRFALLLTALCFAASLCAARAHAQTDQTIYDDSLENGWQNYSWSATDFSSTDYVHTGTHSVKVTYTASYQGFYLHHSSIDTTLYSAITFWINGGTTSGRGINVQAIVGGNAQTAVSLDSYISGGSVAANTWRQATIPLSALKADNNSDFDGFWLQDSTGNSQTAYYVDDITLTAAAAPSVVNLTIDTGTKIRTVDDRVFAVNTAIWDSALNTQATIDLLNATNNRALRFPGGSTSDGYHWKTNTTDSNTWTWASNFDAFANVALKTTAQAFITVNYGSGTSQEAADWVTYSNVTNKYGFKYWEVGNENYGSWEEDSHAIKNDPYTYATQAKDYIAKMKAADSTIKVGVVVVTGENSFANNTNHPATNPRTNVVHNGWTPVLLTTLKSLGVTPDFIIYHRYEQGPGGENDATLLSAAHTWKNDAADLRQQLTDYLGTSASSVELVCTENNSVYSNPGKQTTSLVNGLYYADSVGSLLQTEFNSLVWWDLRNGQDTTQNNSSSLYGWRQYGDYGIMSASNDLYPTYYSMKLLSHFARGGDSIVTASSDYSLLTPYAAKRTDGSLSLLVINKSAVNTLTANINIAGFVPASNGTVYSYGIPQDNAAKTGTGSKDIAQTTVGNASTAFTASFAPYSETIYRLVPAGATLAATADSYVRAGTYADTNFGTQNILIVKKLSGDSSSIYNRASYLKFDLTTVGIAPKSATLTLTVDSSSNPTTAKETLKLYSVSDTTWTETGITWNNAPGLDRTKFLSTGSFLSSQSVALKPGTITFDLTAFVAANLGKVVTLQLIDEATENVYLAIKSKEATSGQPTLTLSN